MNYNDGVYIDVCEKFKDLNFDTAYVAIYYLIDEKYNIIPLRLLICNKDESGNILYIWHNTIYYMKGEDYGF